MNHWNWRRIVLITLIVASKVWDDDSLENVHFPKVMHDISIKEVNSLEQIFLELISFDLAIKGSDYAKYYFIRKFNRLNANLYSAYIGEGGTKSKSITDAADSS